MKNSYQAAWCIGAILAAATLKVAAVTTVVTNDAFDLATAFAPAPGAATVTGSFVEQSGVGQIGSFTDGTATIGFGSGIILSSGDISEIAVGATVPLSTGFGGSPSFSTSALLDQIPGLGISYSDTIRFSLTINAGIINDFVNFSFAYLTSEISPSDRFGIFVDGVYTGILAGSPIDQGHPWINTSVPSLGFEQALYQDANPLNPLFFTLSLNVPNPGSDFQLDFVVADVFGDGIDTAVFLGEFAPSQSALGQIAVPEPSSVLCGVLTLVLGALRRRRSA